jgi:uncharacterized protein (TIGR03435 family)
MNTLRRRIYGAVVRLHPAEFRDHFGREMALDFDDALRDRGFAPLLGDAFLSVARQWKEQLAMGTEAPQPATSHPFLAGQYCMVKQGSSLSAFDLARASVLSVLLFLLVGFAANLPNRHAVGEPQGVQVTHGGADDRSANHASYAARDKAGRVRGTGLEAEPATGNGTPLLHGTGPIRLRPGALGFNMRPKARGGPTGTLDELMWQLTLISVIIWLTAFFLRRIPGIGSKVALGVLGLLGIAASVAFASVPVPVPAVHAQILHAAGPLPSFEVATVKPVQPRPVPPPPPPGGTDNRPPSPRMVGIDKLGGERTDRVHLNSSAQLLILFAYNLPLGSERTRIVGGPDWLGSTQYEIQAKIDASQFAAMQKMTPEQQREQVDLMEQSLLADRFHLKLHFEIREMPVYALVVAKGSKLTPAKEGELNSISSLHSEMTAKAVTLDDFAQSSLWTPIGGRPVIDQTGLKGTYDFTLNWSQEQVATPEPGQQDAPALSPIFTAIQQQLGLKLAPTKAPMEVIVIDSIEKPSEN